MSSVALNLSRKWRSQDFDHIIGQDLAIRILKNSLYLGHYFPVYLFAGQRGCGKTSTARIFAAAVNCSALLLFQKDPKKSVIPCLVCDSCKAMREGNHPDFIEIDAASHTGVDNIRNIIESSSLLPIMGIKRVYLIDEAHMLSKAAFNAALKILEEPPAGALFILATTNPHKIIDTVRSRCFQLFFNSIPHNSLKNHLSFICKEEKIACTDEALDLIIRHTSGSARDAINLLEQVRFSSALVNKDAILAVLGYIDDQHVFSLIQFLLQGKSAELVELLQFLQIDQHKAEFIWQRMILLLRGLLWIKYGVKPQELISSIKILEDCGRLYSFSDLYSVIEALYNQEELFLKTTSQHIFLEIILLSLCSKKKKNDDTGSAPCALNVVSVSHQQDDLDDIPSQEYENKIDITPEQKWQQFIDSLAILNDPLINSVFKQAHFLQYIDEKKSVVIELSKDLIFFKEWLDNSQDLWQPLLREKFSSLVVLDAQFTGPQKAEIVKKIKSEDDVQVAQSITKIAMPKTVSPVSRFQASSRPNNRYANSSYKTKTSVILNKNDLQVDVSDENVWKKSSMLMRHFPGIITEIREKQ